MTLDSLKATRHKTVGAKQTAKALQKGEVRVVFVARDADEAVTREIVRLSREHGIELIYVDTMAALGKACGIEVGAATAALLKDAE